MKETIKTGTQSDDAVNASVNAAGNGADNGSTKESGDTSDYDSAWKEVIEELFEPFFQFFFPKIHSAIDYTKKIEFLGQESRPIMPGNNVGKRLADVLVRVYLKDGSKRCLGIFIHIEVQGRRVTDFMKRVYIYNYRAFDKHMEKNVDVISMALLTDDDKSFRPNEYRVKQLGFDLRMKIPMAKILDYKDRANLRKKTETSKNPMAMVVKAQLKSHEAKKGDGEMRYGIKYQLYRECFARGYGKEKTRVLIKFIDWVIQVPKELTIKLNQDVMKLAEEYKMPYITSFEKIAEERGIKKGRKEGKLETARRFLRRGIDINIIADETGLTKEEIKNPPSETEETIH